MARAVEQFQQDRRQLALTNVALRNEKVRQEELNRELAQAHSQLLQSEKLASIGQLAAGVANEVNNPVGIVSGNLNTLRRYVSGSPEDAISHVDQMDKQWADPEVNLDTTINIVWNELKYKAELRKEYGAIPEIECIPSQLNQFFMNLLIDAAQAIEGRDRI
ncbi:hypothetical protein [Paraburkholderia aspalathi]|uniref:hypothetical protein n=1 Tax=Paraburkholderia aspalathi TaxID=1324617 RepID=UPI0038B72FC8